MTVFHGNSSATRCAEVVDYILSESYTWQTQEHTAEPSYGDFDFLSWPVDLNDPFAFLDWQAA